MANIADILNRPASKVEKPKPLPPGTYLAIVKGQPRQDKTTEKKTDFVEFSLQIQQAGEDVNEEDLKAALARADGNDKRLTDITIKHTCYITEDALWRLTKFLEDCGIDLEENSIGQAIAQTPNCQVLIVLKHKPSPDGTMMYANIVDTAKVDE